MHVHVISAEGEAKFCLNPEIELAKNYQFSRRQLKEIESLIEAHYNELISAWKNTSSIKVTNISEHGLWLLVHGKELFIHYNYFPWFGEQKISSILAVEEVSPGHFYWPELDVDLTEEIIEHPERFPLSDNGA